MKQIYLLTTILFFTIINLNAQIVTLTGACVSDIEGDYSLAPDLVNGRPSYQLGSYYISWSGTRWEHRGGTILGSHNDANTATPPSSSFSPWIPDACNPTGVFTGDGTSNSTLSISEVELTVVNIKAYPNPASDYISISGLKKVENYEIYNLIGQKIRNGITANKEKIDIQNLIKGIYFIKFEKGNMLKFIKE